MMTNPYKGLESYRFWSSAMTSMAPGQIDPVTEIVPILPHHRIATMGSCFAQHLSRCLSASGYTYYVAEAAPEGMDVGAAALRNYGVFSARYGNIYTVLQAEQLYDRAFGTFSPLDDVWMWQGGFVDAFRPTIEPTPFVSPEAVRDAAKQHLAYVKNVFLKCDWLIFTLGLTEAWQSKQDGSIYPLAPGVRGGSYDSSQYEFINFSAGAVSEQLKRFIGKLKKVNPSARVLLTVSPVPLVATYENRHVWVSTTYSKAVLRVAAEEMVQQFDNVWYFPSYEIITSPATGGRYYADDLRQITELGVSHVMKVFRTHFLGSQEACHVPEMFIAANSDLQNNSDVICDEDEILRALTNSRK